MDARTSAMELAIIPFMAEIPNNIASTVFHIIFNALGIKCRSEVSIATGGVDSIIRSGV